MNIGTLLTEWSLPTQKTENVIKKYSVTADILSFKRCRRQYGFFGVRKFRSATATQRYFGTLVHDVLEQINRNYQMKKSLPIEEALPNEEEIKILVEKAHERLILSGIRPYNTEDQKIRAAKLISRFVELIGPVFFLHVDKTEYHLEHSINPGENDEFILHGIVDVLSGAVAHDLGMPYSTEPDDIEVWDYKSGKCPPKDSTELQDYQYQMRVYAHLYRQQTGNYPARCVLVFLGELDDDDIWKRCSRDHRQFPSLFYTIDPQPRHIVKAINDFEKVVKEIEIEKSKPYSEQWLAPINAPDAATCDSCELRYNCERYERGHKQRKEAL